MTDPAAAGGEPIDEKIRSFGLLEQGWRFGEGGPAKEDTVERALRWVRRLRSCGFFEFDAFPGIGGEIQVCAYDGPLFAELTLGENSVDLVIERAGAVEFEGFGISADAALQAISRLRPISILEPTWSGSGRYILVNTTLAGNVSPVLRLRILMEKYPYSTANVAPSQAGAYAPIWRNFTPTEPVALPSFGALTATRYRRTTSNKKTRQLVTSVTTTSSENQIKSFEI